jgi:hypothetical protein
MEGVRVGVSVKVAEGISVSVLDGMGVYVKLGIIVSIEVGMDISVLSAGGMDVSGMINDGVLLALKLRGKLHPSSINKSAITIGINLRFI